MANLIELHVIDYGAQGEYDIFGKTLCRSDVRRMTPAQVEEEKQILRDMFGPHVSIVEVELVGAVA